MNREQDGSLSDRVLVSFHSNAGGGRGVTALHNTSHGGTTPNQVALATALATEVNNDLVAQNGQFEFNWFNRGSNILYEHPDFNYGELNNSVINDEFDATIVEVAFHDDSQDAALMRDPTVRDAVARATYQGMVRYFRGVDGNTTPLTMLPGRVEQVRAETLGAGSVKLTWTAPAANSYNGDAATAYRIYGSTNGYGFDGGTLVAGGATTTFTMNGLDPTLTYYFKVVAVNAGGEGAASEVVAANPVAAPSKVLIVNGFDRLDRMQNPTQVVSGVTIDRVRPRYSNSFDYAAQMAAALHSSAPNVAVDTASNEMVASGAVSLANYSAVFWILGEESTADDTFTVAEQSQVTSYLAGGGKLFVSGSEIGFELDNQGGGAAFYNNQLRAGFVANDANSYSVTGAAGSIFAGLSFAFDNGAKYYDVDSPDRISPLGGSTAALTYSTGGSAAVQYADPTSGSKLVMLAFPFETITTAANRALVMDRVVEFFAVEAVPTEIELILDNDNGPGVYSETGSWETATATGYDGLTYRLASVGSPATARWTFTAPFAGRAEIALQYRAGSNRAASAVYHVDTGDGVETASADQTDGILTWVTLGTFYVEQGVRTITLDALASTGGSFVLADAVRVNLVAAPAPTGDFNDDNRVDGADFLAWQRGVGLADPTLADGDGDADGDVDADDLQSWRNEFGAQAAAAAAASAAATAPEPAWSAAREGDGGRPAALYLAPLDAAFGGEAAAPREALRAALSRDEGSRRGLAVALAARPRGAAIGADAGVAPSPASERNAARRAPDGPEPLDEALSSLTTWSWREPLRPLR
jgi:hypothetical protein